MTAFRHLENPNDFSCKPDKEHIIYRQPQLGLISENPKEQSLTFLIQDQHNKMKNIQLSIQVIGEQD